MMRMMRRRAKAAPYRYCLMGRRLKVIVHRAVIHHETSKGFWPGFSQFQNDDSFYLSVLEIDGQIFLHLFYKPVSKIVPKKTKTIFRFIL